MRLHSLFLGTIGLVGVVAFAPKAAAQILSTNPADFDPVSALNLIYDLAEDGLSRRGFICANNPSMDCGGEMYEVPEDHEIPWPDYMMEDRTSFQCMNNVIPECSNPRHYGVFYTDAPEMLPPLEERTALLWAQLEESMADRPASTFDPLPPATATPAPAPAPIRGLW